MKGKLKSVHPNNVITFHTGKPSSTEPFHVLTGLFRKTHLVHILDTPFVDSGVRVKNEDDSPSEFTSNDESVFTIMV